MEHDGDQSRKRRKRLTRRRSSKTLAELKEESSDEETADNRDNHKTGNGDRKPDHIVDAKGSDHEEMEKESTRTEAHVQNDPDENNSNADEETQDTIPTIEVTLAPDEEEEEDDEENEEVDDHRTTKFDTELAEGELEDEEGEEGEEEEIEEMTEAEKKAMYEAVKDGDIDLLEELMDSEYSDLNMTWFSENLLMSAIRMEKTDMIEFLIDNGCDYNYKTSRLQVVEENGREKLEWFKVSCRQMAYDRNLVGIVEIIDQLNGRLFKFIQPASRMRRLWQPRHERLSRHNSVTSLADIDDGAEADAEFSGSETSSPKLDHVVGSDETTDKNRVNGHELKPKSQRKANSDERVKEVKNELENSETPITEPSTTMTIRSCPSGSRNYVTTTMSRRIRSARTFADTKSNMFRRRANRELKTRLDFTEPKNGDGIFKHRSRPNYCMDNYPRAIRNYTNPQANKDCTKNLGHSNPETKYIDNSKSSRLETAPRKTDSVKRIDTNKRLPIPYQPPRRAWEMSQMNKVLTSLPQIGTSMTRVNSTLRTIAPRKAIYMSQ